MLPALLVTGVVTWAGTSVAAGFVTERIEPNRRLQCLGVDAYDKTLTEAQLKERHPQCYKPSVETMVPYNPGASQLNPNGDVIYVKPGDTIIVKPSD
jgi:hypothetical protein